MGYVDADTESFNDIVLPSETDSQAVTAETSENYEVSQYVMTGMVVGGTASMMSLGIALMIAILKK